MLHCTVAFYGRASHQRKVEIRKAIAQLDQPAPGSVIITGLDLFPERKRNLLVARLSVPPGWAILRDALVGRTGAAGAAPWAPHVTLGKLRHPERFTVPSPPQIRFDNVRFDLQVYP